MPRIARRVIPNVSLHIVQRGHNRNACFVEDADRLAYLAILAKLIRPGACALHAYCLMTNHVHLLMTPASLRGCAELMRDLGQRYVQYFNRRYERTGTLWEGRFRSCLVESPQYVMACHRYIERNPVRAAMADRPSAYRWSSYYTNSGYARSKLLTPHTDYLALGCDETSRHLAYRSLFEEPDEPRFVTAIRDATNGGFALVGDQMKAELASAGARQLERKKHGPAPATEKRNLDLSWES